MSVKIPVSYGEMFDRLTILQLKQEKITSPSAAQNIEYELSWLETAREDVVGFALAARDDGNAAARGLDRLVEDLLQVNRKLWEIEDTLRGYEAAGRFDDAFIQAARSVYFTNDRRSELKREISTLLGSDIMEEKQYTPYPGEIG